MNLKVIWGAIIFCVLFLVYLSLDGAKTNIVLVNDGESDKKNIETFVEGTATTTLDTASTTAPSQN